DAVDEGLDDLEVDVGFEQREADLAKGRLDVLRRQPRFAAERLEDVLEAIGKGIEHDLSALGNPPPTPVPSRAHARSAVFVAFPRLLRRPNQRSRSPRTSPSTTARPDPRKTFYGKRLSYLTYEWSVNGRRAPVVVTFELDR